MQRHGAPPSCQAYLVDNTLDTGMHLRDSRSISVMPDKATIGQHSLYTESIEFVVSNRFDYPDLEVGARIALPQSSHAAEQHAVSRTYFHFCISNPSIMTPFESVTFIWMASGKYTHGLSGEESQQGHDDDDESCNTTGERGNASENASSGTDLWSGITLTQPCRSVSHLHGKYDPSKAGGVTFASLPSLRTSPDTMSRLSIRFSCLRQPAERESLIWSTPMRIGTNGNGGPVCCWGLSPCMEACGA